MTTMIAELYDALRDAGAAEDKARRAAEAMADYDNRFDSLERRIDGVETSLGRRIDQFRAELKEEIGDVRSDMKLLRWMLGAVFAILIPMFLKLFLR